MDTQQLREVALQQGIAPQALDQVVAQVQAHFTGTTPKPADIDAYLAGLSTWTKAGIAWEVFEKLPPGTRIALDRTHNPQPPPPVHSRRPVMRDLTAEELKTLEALPRYERHERGRAMQQTPAPQEEAG